MRAGGHGIWEWALLGVCAAALAMAGLRFVAHCSDALALDMREWQPLQAGRAVASTAKEDAAVPSSLQPLRLVLRPPPTGEVAAVQRVFHTHWEGPHCFRVFSFSPRVAEPSADEYEAGVTVNGDPVARWSVHQDGLGRTIYQAGIASGQGRIAIGFYARRAAVTSVVSAPPAVAFEFATLRRCGRSAARGQDAAR